MKQRLEMVLSLCVIATSLSVYGQQRTGVLSAPRNEATSRTLTPYDLHGIRYADQCSGNDIGARIMNCVTLLPSDPTGHKVGTIVLPNTSFEPEQRNWSTPVVLGPGVSLTGDGIFASSFSCSAQGYCLRHDASSRNGGAQAHSVLPSTLYQGFEITGNGSPDQDIFDLLDAQGLTMRDIAADGATAQGSACIHFEDVNWWTERNNFENVSTLYGCSVGWRFTSFASNPNQPHPSFGYNRFLDIKANPNNGQTAFSFEGNSYIYNSTFRVTINADQTAGTTPASTMFHMQDKAEFYENELHLFGEGPSKWVLDIGAGNAFSYVGQINVSPQVNHIEPGAILIRWGDDGGYGPVTSTGFFNGIYYASMPMSPGTDLNRTTACGDYTGKPLINAPAALGTDAIRLQVICSNVPGYLTQIAYAMEFPGVLPNTAQPRVWQRVMGAGTWAPWREMAWTDQLPLTATTPHLPAKPIAANACAILTAAVKGATSKMVIVTNPAQPAQMDLGLRWDTAYADDAGNVVVPVCNATSHVITPGSTPTFNIRVIP